MLYPVMKLSPEQYYNLLDQIKSLHFGSKSNLILTIPSFCSRSQPYLPPREKHHRSKAQVTIYSTYSPTWLSVNAVETNRSLASMNFPLVEILTVGA